MPIPTYQALLLPLLEFLKDEQAHSLKEAVDYIENHVGLSESERRLRFPSGQRVIAHRVGWTRTYLKMAELVNYPQHGLMKLTPKGKAFLATKPRALTIADLTKIPGFKENWNSTPGKTSSSKAEQGNLTPEERIDSAFEELENDLARELLDQIAQSTPGFFERLVVDLLLKMGYGGSFQDAGRALGKSGDGGIDGIIKEDKLGLDLIYIQAKRWEGTVGRPEIQKFMGALAGNRSKKGVFITTSSFTGDAIRYATSLEAKIVLIDGGLLAELMIEHDVGVAPQSTRTIKRIDADYFAEE
ncbi:MAG: restriction endonuclease [Planctomycetia bacterium]|nr:restriction endonuclease [Planctomycetia bacterium]